MYPDARIVALLSDHFACARVASQEQPGLAARFNVHWTPTLLLLDAEEKTHYRIDPGSLPVEELLPALQTGLGRARFNSRRFDDATRHFDAVLAAHPRAHAAPEALYWRGVCHYKKGDREGMLRTWKQLPQDYPGSPWARAVSFLQKS